MEDHRRRLRHVDHSAVRHGVEPSQRAEQGRLARAARTQERDKRAGRDIEVQTVQDRRPVGLELPRQPADPGGGAHARTSDGFHDRRRRSNQRTRASTVKPSSA